MQKKILPILTLFIFASCAGTSPTISSDYDQFEELHIDRVENNIVDQTIFPVRAIYINPMVVTRDDGTFEFLVQVKYTGTEWMFIRNGESLQLIISGEQYRFETDGRPSRNSGGGTVREYAYYQVEPETLRRLAYDTGIQVRVSGDRSWDFEMDESSQKIIRGFYEEYVEPII